MFMKTKENLLKHKGNLFKHTFYFRRIIKGKREGGEKRGQNTGEGGCIFIQDT